MYASVRARASGQVLLSALLLLYTGAIAQFQVSCEGGWG